VHRTRPAFTAQHAQSCLPREVGTTRQPRRQGAHTISAAKGDQTLVQANFALLRDLCTHQKKRKDCKFLCFFDSFIKFQIPRASPSAELLTPLPAHFWGHVLPRFTAARTAPHTSDGIGGAYSPGGEIVGGQEDCPAVCTVRSVRANGRDYMSWEQLSANIHC